MPDGDYNKFRDAFSERPSNNPLSWSVLADQLQGLDRVLKDDIELGLIHTNRGANKTTAILYCALQTAKRESIELGFHKLINEAKGSTFGFRLLNWTLNKLDFSVPNELKADAKRVRSEIANSLDAMIDMEPIGYNMSVDQTFDWIKEQGGTKKLAMIPLDRAKEKKAQKERDAKEGEIGRRQREAEKAGFASIEEHEIFNVQKTLEAQEALMRSKFPVIKQNLVADGSPVVGTPVEGQICIFSGGQYHGVSDKGEYSMLSCIALQTPSL